ncbi:hypothetical protein MWU54_07970 [Marivita sp. S6314]|uniref:DUF6958 family protein n=1 Tax=Marivita sp. S6314 TaxID=2926406 RepID=UPI001FF342AD|nr:hypothetical protein [Marivita sp. S6314]MCK0149953.1 hypothetical protein [Marivita sp. S6314]
MARVATEDKVGCRTPAEGRDGVTNIPKWKFDVLRDAILTVLRDGDIRFSDLKPRLEAVLPEDVLNRLGSLGWHATCVKLEMEVRGEVARVEAKGPQIMMLGRNAPKGQ